MCRLQAGEIGRAHQMTRLACLLRSAACCAADPRLVILKPCVRIDSGMMFCVDIISIISAKYQTGAKQGSISNEPLVPLYCAHPTSRTHPSLVLILMAGCYSHLLEPLICCKSTVQLPTNHLKVGRNRILASTSHVCLEILTDLSAIVLLYIPRFALGVCAQHSLHN